jgi:hypothetical protein
MSFRAEVARLAVALPEAWEEFLTLRISKLLKAVALLVARRSGCIRHHFRGALEHLTAKNAEQKTVRHHLRTK